MHPEKLISNNILETIGNTPMVRLNTITRDIPGTVLAKVEYFNPGHSVKDRMALKMIEDAEARGELKPGGTIIECTSGNTGMGLALVAAVKGYRLICTMSDKQSKEKMDILRAMGAEIRVCPTNVAPEHPESYYSVAERLHKEIPNSVYPYQYDNLSNARAHYESTGPEIWEQTAGKITHFVVGVGTGGTISGVARYLREKNPAIKIWGVDSYGSVFKKYHETGEFDSSEIYSYSTEGIGEDILPKNVDFSLIDHFEKVSDRDGALVARELARKEGLLLGWSAGSAFQAIRQLKNELDENSVVVVLFHDHGSRYVGKIYNDEWMEEQGYLNEQHVLVGDVSKKYSDRPLHSVQAFEPLGHAIHLMRVHNLSQLPVRKGTEFVGSLSDRIVFDALVRNPKASTLPVSQVMAGPYPEVDPGTNLREMASRLSADTDAVLVRQQGNEVILLTRHELMMAMS